MCTTVICLLNLPLAHGKRGDPQLLELKGQLAATCEARPLVNTTFIRVHDLVEEAARRQQSLERLSEINRTSREAKHREASRLEKEVRCHDATWSELDGFTAHCVWE